MKDTFTRRASITVIAVVGLLASLGSASAARAQQSLSEGCQALNDPALDARYSDQELRDLTFAAGDRITVTADHPSDYPEEVYLVIKKSDFDDFQIVSAAFPGSVSYVIPASGEYAVVDWSAYGLSDRQYTATFEVSCTPTAPDCSAVTASPSVLKADGKLQQVALSGATDPQSEALTYSISAVTQDEPTTGGFRNDLKTPDAGGVSGNSVSLRGERNPTLNGRVYRIHYTVSDASGFECSGMVTVGVPTRKGVAAVDDGTQASWNSFTGAIVQ